MENMLKRMNDDKRLNLINSAMKEFGTNRFDKASTNVMVKEAGISKGLLYHYFKTKLALYDYLVEFTMKSMGEAIVENVHWDDGDLLNRMHRVINIKLGILEQYPYMIEFGKTMYEKKSVEEIKKMVAKFVPDLYLKVYSHNVDFSLFKDHIDVNRVINMIQLFLDGYSEQMVQKYKSQVLSTGELKKEMEDLTIYLDMFKDAYYK